VARIALRSYPTLSGGEQRRVLLARALATEAPIIALDEPTATRDVAHQLDFFERLRELTTLNRTIVPVLHDLREAERFCDAALVLDQGGLVYQGASKLPETLVADVLGVRLRADAEGRYERVVSAEESP
jgi:iron complex transport system ATP-binding protein